MEKEAGDGLSFEKKTREKMSGYAHSLGLGRSGRSQGRSGAPDGQQILFVGDENDPSDDGLDHGAAILDGPETNKREQLRRNDS